MSLRVDVKDYGAVGDGVTDDTDAINAAIAAVNVTSGAVYVSRGTYMINENGLNPLGDRVRLVGDNRHNCILRLSEAPLNHFVRGSGSGWEIRNLTIDANEMFPPVNANSILAQGTRWTIAYCDILGIAKIGIGGGGNSEHWNILYNRIIKPTPSGAYVNAAINMTHATGRQPATLGLIKGNVVSGAPIGGWLTFSEISYNTVTESRYGSGIWSGYYPNSSNLLITNNICHHARGQNTVDHTWTSGYEIWAPDSIIADNVAHDNAASGFIIGGQRTIVRHNTSYNNGAEAPSGGRSGFGVRRVNSDINANYSQFLNNNAYDSRYPNNTQTQEWGICPQAGLVGIVLAGNQFTRNKLGANCRT